MNLWSFDGRHSAVSNMIARSKQEDVCFVGEGFLYEWIVNLITQYATNQDIEVTVDPEGISFYAGNGSFSARGPYPFPIDTTTYYSLSGLPPHYQTQINLNKLIL